MATSIYALTLILASTLVDLVLSQAAVASVPVPVNHKNVAMPSDFLHACQDRFDPERDVKSLLQCSNLCFALGETECQGLAYRDMSTDEGANGECIILSSVAGACAISQWKGTGPYFVMDGYAVRGHFLTEQERHYEDLQDAILSKGWSPPRGNKVVNIHVKAKREVELDEEDDDSLFDNEGIAQKREVIEEDSEAGVTHYQDHLTLDKRDASVNIDAANSEIIMDHGKEAKRQVKQAKRQVKEHGHVKREVASHRHTGGYATGYGGSQPYRGNSMNFDGSLKREASAHHSRGYKF